VSPSLPVFLAARPSLHQRDNSKYDEILWPPGRAIGRRGHMATSNAYAFVDPQMSSKPTFPSKSELPTGTGGQELPLTAERTLHRKNPLHQALLRRRSNRSRA
jgi:hypothetical protein